MYPPWPVNAGMWRHAEPEGDKTEWKVWKTPGLRKHFITCTWWYEFDQVLNQTGLSRTRGPKSTLLMHLTVMRMRRGWGDQRSSEGGVTLPDLLLREVTERLRSANMIGRVPWSQHLEHIQHVEGDCGLLHFYFMPKWQRLLFSAESQRVHTLTVTY